MSCLKEIMSRLMLVSTSSGILVISVDRLRGTEISILQMNEADVLLLFSKVITLDPGRKYFLQSKKWLDFNSIES